MWSNVDAFSDPDILIQNDVTQARASSYVRSVFSPYPITMRSIPFSAQENAMI